VREGIKKKSMQCGFHFVYFWDSVKKSQVTFNCGDIGDNLVRFMALIL